MIWRVVVKVSCALSSLYDRLPTVTTSDNASNNKIGNPLGPTGERVRENIKRIREEQKVGYRELSERLKGIGRPIHEIGLARIEKGKRRVDADDLVALAIALGVSPNRILLPEDADNGAAELTAGVTATEWSAWKWAEGEWPLLTEEEGHLRYNYEGRELVEGFQRRSLPPRIRGTAGHPAARSAKAVLHNIDNVLKTEDLRGTPVPDVMEITARRAQAAEAPERLRAALGRLNAEVSALLEATTQEDPQVIAAYEDLMSRFSRTFAMEEVRDDG